jgi:uncharacterized protein YecE (DUF72 family)
MRLFCGTSGFQYDEWKGRFYPAGLPKAKMLAFYATRFNSTESNYTFRSIPSEKTIARWYDGTPEGFKFALKAPQKITHFAKLRDCGGPLNEFSQAVVGLGEKCGPLLLQLPPFFKKDVSVLKEFLSVMPRELRAAFEFRHESWFDDEVYAALKSAKAALCIADTDDLEAPREVTADFGYLRLRGADYEVADIRNWARFLNEQRGRWGEAFVYFKHEETGTGPEFAKRLMDATGC